MNPDQINKILATGEGTRIEFKESRTKVPSDLYDTIVSFSNTEGGIIILGADDDGNVKGVNPDNVLSIKKNIVTALNDRDCINPPVVVSPVEIDHPEGNLIILQIPVSSVVHTHAGRIFWRDADADLDISNNQDRIADLFLRKRHAFSESEIYPYLAMEDLREDLFDRARSIIRGYQPMHPWVSASNEQILKESSLYRQEFQTGKEGLTLAAALIFGKDTTIHNIVPAYKIDAILRVNNIDRYDDRLLLRTNLIESYVQLMEFIRKHLDEKFFMEDGQRKDLRELIFREVISNMIVHREYTSPLSSELIIYSNRVVATNPNIPKFSGPIDPNSFNPYPKNPNIRKFFSAFGWADELGSGIRNTNKYLPFYVLDAKPAFIEGGTFITEIPLVHLNLSVFRQEIINWFGFPETLNDYFESNLSKLPLDVDLENYSWKDMILHLVPGWNDKGTRLEPLDWPKNQVFEVEDIKKVPGWDRNGTKLLHKKIRYLIRILLLTLEPVSLEKLMGWIDYANRKTFRENYLLPLQQVEFIRMTKPDTPQAPDQKYVITEKGKRFITGVKF